MISERERAHLRHAVELARRGGRATAPNPRVGAVVVQGEEVVGEGWHEFAGGPHAERVALERAGDRAKGSTLYVSLEPCDHEGRTPPCTEAIVERGVARVVVPLIDPDPRVSGNGAARLRDAGLEVVVADEASDEARGAIEDYVVHRRERRPFVALKIAATLDGRIADRGGASRWITGEEARTAGRKLRDRYGAILVGAGTVAADDPILLPPTPVEEGGAFHRVVLDGRLSVSPEARLFATPRDAPVLVFASADAPRDKQEALEARGVEVIRTGGASGRVDLSDLLAELGRRDVIALLVEGGGLTHGSFLEEGLVDKAYWFVAPKVVGDLSARAAVSIGAVPLAEARDLRFAEVERIGEDVALTLYPRTPSPPCSPDSSNRSDG